MRKAEFRRILSMETNTQKDLRIIQKSKDLVNKQLIFREVCKDLMIVRDLVARMMKKTDTKTENQLRLLFKEFVVDTIGFKYANQMNLSQPIDAHRKELRTKLK